MSRHIPKVSVVFPVKNEGKNVKMTLDSLFNVKTNVEVEAILVDDASTDEGFAFLSTYEHKQKVIYVRAEGVGPSVARNLGAEAAHFPYIAFCDAHMTFEHFWLDRLVYPLASGVTDAVCPAIGSLEDPSIVGYGQSLTPSLKIKWNPRGRGLFETAILPGACIVMKKETFDDIGGFEPGFYSWGHEDVEISIKLWLFGYRCHCDPTVTILHLFRTAHPYSVNYEGIYYNLMRMAYLHFDDARIERAKSLIVHGSSIKIDRKVLQDGVLQKRTEYMKKRKTSIDTLFKKFSIYF
ncbi:glycosyltransferase [Rossellomorea sp. RS05]|uniref:glycosyltransferase family 2 protein n=1 Tax=Rossellomorea sp. RS05 TaxID=3149166 RepID=UPI0032215526